jgi:hypothetical protein
VTDKLNEMWAALEAHEPQRGYSEAWGRMLKERTEEAAEAARCAAALTEVDAWRAWQVAAKAEKAAQRAIDAIRARGGDVSNS